ncbi:uncharacterized protein PSANT_02187 [Moesziomyces antarcticus]|uniref:Zn(2)-C6 fungal-type domain-containing protein n=2 Tax=Pseudozyma antarctica TaxID=84753 RepID=A0A5C3FJD6_PSEA2|nr:uncharacterized protein PSANT_02187 [Moesziomyces antarcticus]
MRADRSVSAAAPRKRPLARRSCLKCREKKARCELPDVYVDSAKTPLPAEKRCHRCNVLGIDCVVWDGDRKRKPRLERLAESPASSSAHQETATSSHSSQRRPLSDGQSPNPTGRLDRASDTSSSKSSESPFAAATRVAAPQNIDIEQLGASDVMRDQRLLLGSQKGWRTVSKNLLTLIGRLDSSEKYSRYLSLRIDAPPSTPDILAFLHPDKAARLEGELQVYLVGHPYLPSLSQLHSEQSQNPTRPRALLLATMTLLGLKGFEDALGSTDIRALSNYVDRLGTQMLLSSPQDIHLVMAFELLISHEPGLVGTAASQFEPQGRGLGLASENLLTCAIQIAKELGLDHAHIDQPDPASMLTEVSLWSCLRVWESLFCLIAKRARFPDGLDAKLASEIREVLHSVDDHGKKLPELPGLQDSLGSASTLHHNVRTYAAQMERRIGKDGVLRSAGRTVICLRMQAFCLLTASVRRVEEVLSDPDLELREKQMCISDLYESNTSAILAIRDGDCQLGKFEVHSAQCMSRRCLLTQENASISSSQGAYSEQRIVRLWEQLLHIECSYACTVFSRYCTSALYTGKLNGHVEVEDMIRSIRDRLHQDKPGVVQLVSKMGRSGVDFSHDVLASISHLDRQPALRKRMAAGGNASGYLHQMPALLVSALAVDTARSSFESMAFVFVTWGGAPSYFATALTLIEAAAGRVSKLTPQSSQNDVETVAEVASEYLLEMVNTAQVWQLYYRVYRPFRRPVATEGTAFTAEEQQEVPNSLPAPHRHQHEPTVEVQTEITTSARSAAASAQTSMGPLQTRAQRASQPRMATAGSPSAVHEAADGRAYDAAAFSAVPTIEPLQHGGEAPSWKLHDNSALLALPASISSAVPLSDLMYSTQSDASIDAGIPFDLEAFLRDIDQLF